MPWEAAAISAGSKLLGGLLGGDKGPSLRQQRNNMKKTEHQRFKWLVKGAQNAGFNPLSVLRATGGAMAPQLTPQTPLNARAILGEAIADFGGTFAQDAIQRATEERAQEDWKERFDYGKKNAVQPLRTGSSSSGKSGKSYQNKTQAVSDPFIPLRSAGDDDAATENILGTLMPFDAGDRDEASGGDILGSIQTMKEWFEASKEQKKKWYRLVFGPNWDDLPDMEQAVQQYFYQKGNKQRQPPLTTKQPWVSSTLTSAM